MPWAKGQSGNPYGHISKREAETALRHAVHETVAKGKYSGKTKLKVIADKIAEAAMDGEPWACDMVYNRLDGKPVQFIDQHMTHDVGEVFVDLLKAINERRAAKVIEHSEASDAE